MKRYRASTNLKIKNQWYKRGQLIPEGTPNLEYLERSGQVEIVEVPVLVKPEPKKIEVPVEEPSSADPFEDKMGEEKVEDKKEDVVEGDKVEDDKKTKPKSKKKKK